MTKSRKRAGLALVPIAFAFAALALFASGALSNITLPNVAGAAGIESPSASPSPSASADKKGNDFVIDMPKRGPHGRLNADGIAKRGNTEAFRAQILEQAKRDPLTLFHYYQASPLGITDPLKSASVIAKGGKIEDGNVYSERGIRAYEEWAVLWKVADIDAVEEVTYQGANTGVDGTQPTYSEGVHGKDKSGYDIAYRDGEGDVIVEHSALNRCGQPTTDNPPPNVKPGKTDNPPPEKKPRPEKPKPEPTPTPTPEKVCLPPTPHGTWPLCKDDPIRDVQNNPGVPAGSTGPGTTPVGTDPGPAEPPVDSPTGCNGPCPEPDKPSSPNPPSKPQPTLPKPTQPPVTPDPVRESPEPEEPIPTPEPEW